MVFRGPFDHDVTVKGCVCAYNYRLTNGIYRLIYCPALSCIGRGKETRTWAAVIIISSLDFVVLNNISALGNPRPVNSLF